MFQLGFGMPSDLQSSSKWWMGIFRDFFSIIDSIIYRAISWVYQIVFYIANADFFATDLISDFFGRVQLVIGVFMIFKLAISVLQVVINPDLLNDQKKGMGKIVTRIITMLIMLTSIMPLDGIPDSAAPDHSYNQYLKKYGILYGTMYSLQYRIMSNNTLGTLVTGDNTYQTFYVEESSNEEYKDKVKDSANLFSSSILRGFVRPNLNTDAGDEEDYKSDENYICKNDDVSKDVSFAIKAMIVSFSALVSMPTSIPMVIALEVTDLDKLIADYLGVGKIGGYYVIWGLTTTKPSDIMELVDIECDAGYAFAYLPVLSTIVGIIVLFMLVGYCKDIAIRTMKLAIIRLLSPIAIISYIDPQSSEKGMFAHWTKVLIATYLDLFLRILILYIVVFFGQAVMNGYFDLKLGSSLLEIIAQIIIVLSLFHFGRIAPKFISEALGLKGMMGNVGLSGLLSVAGTLRAGGNMRDVVEAYENNSRIQVESYNQGKQAPGLFQNFTSGSDVVAQRLTGDDRTTYAKMMRTRRQNARTGITPEVADEIHSRKFKLDDDAVRAQNLYDNFNKGNLTQNEMDGLAYQFGHYNNQTGRMEMNDAEYQRAREYLQDNALRAKTEAAKWSAYDDAVQKKTTAAGNTPTFEEKYAAQNNTSHNQYGPNARASDLASEDGRRAIFNQGFVQGVRNIAGIPGNEMRQHRADVVTEQDRRQSDRHTTQMDSNEDIINSRNP